MGDDRQREGVLEGALEGEKYRADFEGEMSYGDYLRLDDILNAQSPRTDEHDEMLFIIIHQAKELWMKLMKHELRAAVPMIQGDTLRPAFKMMARVKRIQEQLISAWTVLTTMTPADYLQFRDSLGHASGFQSYQYRAVEFLLGNKVPAMMKVHAHRPEIHAELEQLLNAPGIYDAAVILLAKRGFDIDKDCIERDWSERRESNDSVIAAWSEIYNDTDRYWDLYELGEDLMDIDDLFQTWRFRHANTVERVIGHKTGTGGTSGVAYLRRAVGIKLFDELWAVRTGL